MSSPDFENREQAIETGAEREAHYWKGQALKPFSFSRQAAAQRVMMEDSSPMEKSVLLVYLCTLEPLEIDRVRGDVEIAAFRQRMAEWADGEGVTLTDREAITKVANEIWGEMQAAKFKLQKTTTAKEQPPPNG